MMKMNEYDENDDDILKSFISFYSPFSIFLLVSIAALSQQQQQQQQFVCFCSVLYTPPSFCFSFVVLLFVPSLFILFLLLSSGFMLLYLCDFSGSNLSFCYRGFFSPHRLFQNCFLLNSRNRHFLIIMNYDFIFLSNIGCFRT